MKVILLGYMASGKSTIGKVLAKKIYLPFIDLDFYIEEKEKSTIQEIFKKKGEIFFRKIEHQYLKELLENKENFVLSLGGGTPCYSNNMELLKDSKTFYLRASIGVLVDRLIDSNNIRPLVASIEKEKLPEFIAKHLFERSFFYDQSKYKISVDNKTVSEIVTAIRILLH